MTDLNELLLEAELYNTSRVNLSEYQEVITKLRHKGASWREIAKFLNDKANITVDHTKIARTAASWAIETSLSHDIPLCDDYIIALESIRPSQEELDMLLYHYQAHNRTTTYSELSNAVGQRSYQYANKVYGGLAKKLCDQLSFTPIPNASGRPFYGSVIGMKYPYAGRNDEFQLVMHHELSKAIEKLNINNKL